MIQSGVNGDPGDEQLLGNAPGCAFQRLRPILWSRLPEMARIGQPTGLSGETRIAPIILINAGRDCTTSPQGMGERDGGIRNGYNPVHSHDLGRSGI